MIIQNTRGEMVDLTTGQVVGAAEGTPAAAPAPADARKPTGVDQETMGADKVMGLVNQMSWGLNTGLFSLPDAAQRGIGAAMGLDKDQIFQFTKLFNRGEKAPVNASERYTRAIFEGIGGSLPITGTLAYAAAVSPVVRMARPGAGVLKNIADDAISFMQKSPKAAVAADLAFSAGYETMRQAVEENVSNENEYKNVYKELLPAAAFMGVPLAAANLPSVLAAKFLKKKIDAASSAMGEIEQDVMAGMPGIYKLPLVRIVPSVLMKNAEKKLEKLFGPIAESPEAQQALKQLEAAMADPRVAEAGFMFDAAETSMYAPLVQRKAELLQQLGPKELESTKQRINQNQKKLQDLFQSFTPQARQPIEDAFRAAQAERQSFFDDLIKQKTTMSDAEIAAVSERLGPQDIDRLNDELRGVLMARMEMDSVGREKILSRMGLRQGVSEEGLPVATREQGKSLFPARDMEQAAVSLIEKYKPERPSMYVKTPEPIRLLERFVQTQQVARDQMEGKMVTQLADQAISEQLRSVGTDLPADFQKALRDSIMTMVRGEKVKGKRRGVSMADLGAAPDAQGNIAVATGIPGRRIIINPEQIRADAKRIAEADTGIDINLPEALDYLQSAIRFRNDSLATYNDAMGKGRTRITDAQRYLDTGDAVFKDIEGLILQHVPKIRNEYEGMKMVLDDYRAGYEQSLPLLMAQKKGKGDEFLLPNEALMQKAFANAGNLRQLQVSLMNSPEASGLVERGAIDWIRSKGVVNADGLVDPKKIRQVLDKNRNIVEALPETVRTKLQDEVTLAEDYVARLGELDRRKVTAKNTELDNMLAKAIRPDANAANTMEAALRDPATMRNLVDQLSKDPDNLAALRRSVYGIATEGAQGGMKLSNFLASNEKSLGVLFKDTNHLNDLKTLADLQRRVNAFADVTGQIPAFESLDESLKRVFGFGIQYGTTTFREAKSGRINPTTASLALLVRLTGSLENQLYERIFTKALEDPAFAKRITSIGTPAEAKAVAAELEKIGISQTKYRPGPVRLTSAELAQQARDEEAAARVPQQRAETARQMLQRTLPVAPPTRGTSFNPRLPTTPPAAPAGGGVNLMYPVLFPNDPISGMLQQRQAAMQRPAQ